MPGPFPGMDPWLEDEEVFPNLHNALLIYMQEELNGRLPPEYVAASANRVWVDDESRREPDVSVLGANGPGATAQSPTPDPYVQAGMIAIAIEYVAEIHEEPYLEIRSTDGSRLVTAIEVLSRSNKSPGTKGRDAYRLKQGEYRLSNTHLVEIDLLRGGSHTTAVPLDRLRQEAGAFDYHVSVLRAAARDQYFAAPIQLADRLPTVPIPLDPGVLPVMLDFQPLLDRCYDSGRYGRRVRYRRACSPPLTPEQQTWAEGILKAKGLLP